MPDIFETHEVFNQSPPFQDINLFASDMPLVEAAHREGAADALESLSKFGTLLGRADVLDEARIVNIRPPVLYAFDQKGRRRDTVEFHPTYHHFMARSMAQGLHCSVWEHIGRGEAPRAGRFVARAAGIYLMSQVEPGHVCPITMTHASVAPLMNEPILASRWLPKILARDYDPSFRPMDEKRSVTLGMGMTEKQGGTDVRANTTRAEPAGTNGEYRLTGHKWFMSAPMCDAFLMLAQAPGGLTCFLVPRFAPDGQVNGLHFQRLKDKLGNRSNASSEVEFVHAYGQRVGAEGRGVATIIEMVNLTRLDCAVASAGLMRWGLANAIHHVRHRAVFQKKLIDQPLMLGVLADMALDVEAALALSFRLARAYDRAREDPTEAAFARVMTPVIKYWCCKIVPPFAYEAMECMGGNGYVEDGVMARLYREAPLNAIWEGSGNVMCLDFLRALAKDTDAAALVLDKLMDAAKEDARIAAVLGKLQRLLSVPARAEMEARYVVEQIAMAMAADLLRRAGTESVAELFSASRLGGGFRHTYGTFGGEGRAANLRAIVERMLPG